MHNFFSQLFSKIYFLQQDYEKSFFLQRTNQIFNIASTENIIKQFKTFSETLLLASLNIHNIQLLFLSPDKRSAEWNCVFNTKVEAVSNAFFLFLLLPFLFSHFLLLFILSP
jgi:hypothetical protein